MYSPLVKGDIPKNKIIGAINVATSGVKLGFDVFVTYEVYEIIRKLSDSNDEYISDSATLFIKNWQRRNLPVPTVYDETARDFDRIHDVE